MELKFRLLEPDDIEVRVGSLNAGGANLLLYKNARVDQQILDEKVGSCNWQRRHCNGNANCIVSIWDDEKKQWIEKEDTGSPSNVEANKGLASDSFKRACFSWGIGRELYTADRLNLFIGKDHLNSFAETNGKRVCYDNFAVTDIQYENNKIASVTIAVVYRGKETYRQTFSKNTTSASQPQNKTVSTPSPAKANVQAPTPQTKTSPVPANNQTKALIAEDEILLMGNLKGRKYGEVKNMPAFASFLGWAKNSDTKYPDPKQMDQFTRIKELAKMSS